MFLTSKTVWINRDSVLVWSFYLFVCCLSAKQPLLLGELIRLLANISNTKALEPSLPVFQLVVRYSWVFILGWGTCGIDFYHLLPHCSSFNYWSLRIFLYTYLEGPERRLFHPLTSPVLWIQMASAAPPPASGPAATENPNPGTSTSSSTTGDGGNQDSTFECNICLDTSKDAVISLCGHLFW